MTAPSNHSVHVDSSPATMITTGNEAETATVQAAVAPAVQDAPVKPVPVFNTPNVFRSKLAHIDNIAAKDGFVTIHTRNGKVHRKTAEEVRDVARDCASTLQHIKQSEARGVQVPKHVKDQTLELISKLSIAYREAKHQQETALKLDHETRFVQRVTDDLQWQKGGLVKERGEYTTDHLPEENNIHYLIQRFQYLKEGEISAILRATDVPYKTRMQILAAMNGKRQMEEMKMTKADVLKLVRGEADTKLEMPTGVGLDKIKT